MPPDAALCGAVLALLLVAPATAATLFQRINSRFDRTASFMLQDGNQRNFEFKAAKLDAALNASSCF